MEENTKDMTQQETENVEAGVENEEAVEEEVEKASGEVEDTITEEQETESREGEAEETEEKKGFFGKKKKDKKDAQIEELTDRVRRQMAEFDNFRKRTEKEKAGMFDLGAKSAIEKVIPVVDNFERGLASVTDEDDAFAQGMKKIYQQLMDALEGLGVKPIEAVGQPFDSNYHNAVLHVEDESLGENIVVDEFQKGYMYKDTVLRHSMVRVAN